MLQRTKMYKEKIDSLSFQAVVSYLLFFTEKVNYENKILNDRFVLELFEKCWECQNGEITSNVLYDEYSENLSYITDDQQGRTQKESNLINSILYMFYYLIWTMDGIERSENPAKPFWGSELGDIDDSFFENSLELSLKCCDDTEHEIILRNTAWNYLTKIYPVSRVGIKGVILSKEYLQDILES